MLPKFNGKDKSFFFLNYEGTRIRQGRTFNTLVPSEAFRKGDFSSLSTPIRDPLTGVHFPGTSFPPIVSTPQPLTFCSSCRRRIPRPEHSPMPLLSATIRIRAMPATITCSAARILSQSDIASTTWRRSTREPISDNGGSEPAAARAESSVGTRRIFFRQQSSMSLRLGYTRMHNANLNQGLGTNYTAQAGIGGFAETSQNFPGFPQLSITGFQGIAGNAFQPLVNPDEHV